jgi:hypothetical protein
MAERGIGAYVKDVVPWDAEPDQSLHRMSFSPPDMAGIDPTIAGQGSNTVLPWPKPRKLGPPLYNKTISSGAPTPTQFELRYALTERDMLGRRCEQDRYAYAGPVSFAAYRESKARNLAT